MSEAENPAGEVDPDHLHYLRDIYTTATQDFDKAILTLSSAAIGISLAFLDKIAPDPVRTRWLVLVAWLMLTLSLLSTVVSFLTSQNAIRSDYVNYGAGKPVKGGNRWTPSLNYAAAALLVGGVLSLILFAYLNLDTNGGP